MDKEAWIQALSRGESLAWERFFDEVGPMVIGLGSRMGLGEADQKELLQLTSVRVFRRLETLESPNSFSSWVYGISMRLAYDIHRGRKPESDIETVDWGAQEFEEPDPLDGLVRIEQIAQLQDALDQIDPACKALLTALYLNEPRKDYRTISTELSIPIGGIGPTRARCLKKLQREFKSVSERPIKESKQQTETFRVDKRGPDHD